jgi:hypothetical protein
VSETHDKLILPLFAKTQILPAFFLWKKPNLAGDCAERRDCNDYSGSTGVLGNSRELTSRAHERPAKQAREALRFSGR